MLFNGEVGGRLVSRVIGGGRLVGAILLLAGVLALTSCQAASPPPLPTPASPQQLHEELKSDSIVREILNERLDDREHIILSGVIDRVDGASIQFMIKHESFNRDEFVECEFDGDEETPSLYRGQTVTVYGRLDKAFTRGFSKYSKSVKLNECRLLAARTQGG